MQERSIDDLKHDLSLIVASAESDLDDQEFPDVREILETLLYRVILATEEEPSEVYAETLPERLAPMVGRIDRCDLKVSHVPSECGKPGAHR